MNNPIEEKDKEMRMQVIQVKKLKTYCFKMCIKNEKKW